MIFGALAGVSDDNAHLGIYPSLGSLNTRTIQLIVIESTAGFGSSSVLTQKGWISMEIYFTFVHPFN